SQAPVGPYPHLSLLWLGAGPRPERGAEYPSGRAGPSGANVAHWGERRLSTPRLTPWGACHLLGLVGQGHSGSSASWSHHWTVQPERWLARTMRGVSKKI